MIPVDWAVFAPGSRQRVWPEAMAAGAPGPGLCEVTGNKFHNQDALNRFPVFSSEYFQ